MDCFDKVEELLLAEGYTKEEIPAIMVSLVEQGLDPTSVVLGGLANMFGWLPKKKKVEPKKVEPKKVQPKTPSWGPENVKGPSQPNFVTGSGRINKAISTGKGSPWMVKLDPVPAASSKLPQPKKPPVTPPGQMQIPGTSARAQDLRNVTRNPNLGLPGNKTGFAFDTGEIAKQSKAPKPAWTGSSGSGQGFPRPPRVPRDAGSYARQRMLLKPTPTPTTAPTGIFSRIKKLRGSTPAQLALNLAAGEALDRYVTKPVARAGGNALARGILDATGKGEKARQINPQLYGKSGPTLTPEIKTGIQQRSKLAQQKAETQAASQPKPTETGERSAAVNAAKQQTAKAEAQRRRASAADFDKTFAAKRAAGEKEFTWRGKRYSTKLK